MAVTRTILEALKTYKSVYREPARVYYPGCGNDATPSVVFPRARVVYVDPVQAGLDEIRASFPHAEVYCKKAEEMHPIGQFDLSLHLHSHAPFETHLRDLRREGHLLIANKGSDRAFDDRSLVLLAALIVHRREMWADTEDLERYKEIDPNHPEISFSNRRLVKAPFYVFKKIA